MAHYRSNLASLRKLRCAAHDAQSQRVADAQRAAAALDEQAAAVNADLAAATESHRLVREGEFSVTRILEIERYELVLKAEEATISKQQDAVGAELERRRTELALAEQQLRVVEKLDARRRREFEQQEARREQASLDEIGTNQFLRKSRERGSRTTFPRT